MELVFSNETFTQGLIKLFFPERVNPVQEKKVVSHLIIKAQETKRTNFADIKNFYVRGKKKKNCNYTTKLFNA